MSSKITTVVKKHNVAKSQKSRRRNKSAIKPRVPTYNTSIGLNTPAPSYKDSYAKCLSDPFNFRPIRLGHGTMIETDVVTLYFRGTVNANADGTLSMGLFPCAEVNSGGPILYNNSGSAGTTWQSASFQNITAVQAAYTEGRVIAGGLKCIPQIAGTAAPGIVYAGSTNPNTYNQFVTQSTASAAVQPTISMGAAALGASAYVRPIDYQSFVFFLVNIENMSASVVPSSTIPLISFAGIGNATTVYYEAVLHIEAFSTTVDAMSANLLDDKHFTKLNEPSMTDFFPSLDSMWNYTKRVIGPAYELATDYGLGASAFGATYIANRELRRLH